MSKVENIRHIVNKNVASYTSYTDLVDININSTLSSVRVTTELHEKHAHAYLVIAVLLPGQSTRVLLHGTKSLVLRR